MTLPKRLFASSFASLAIVFVVFLLASVCFASDIYFAQSSTGGNNGADCADAYAYNDGTHGVNVAGNWVAGNTLHLCGTFSFGTNAATIITAEASGRSGSPITIKFESGASLQASYWNSNTGAISLNGKNYITIEGNSTGVIENTLNGTGGATCPAGSCSQQAASLLIWASGSSDIQIQDFNGSGALGPVYVHTQCEASSGCDAAVSVYGTSTIQYEGTNVSIHDNVIHDVSAPITNSYLNDDNVQIYNNQFYNFNSGIQCAGADYVLQHLYIYNNWFHDMAAWDTGTADAYHHEAIHCYNGSGGKIQNLYVYNNLFNGNNGQCCVTSWIWLDPNTPWTDSTGTLYMWNNVLYGENASGNGLMSLSHGNGHMILNNTFLGPGEISLGNCVQIGVGATNVTFENNIAENCSQFIAEETSPAASILTWDYNLYAYASSGNPLWQFATLSTGSPFTHWQSLCSCDSHSQAQLGSLWADLSSTTGVPSAGFVGIGAGVNLSSLATTGALASLQDDTGAGNIHTPVARPSSGAWDIGAYAYGGSSGQPSPPTGLNAIVQ